VSVPVPVAKAPAAACPCIGGGTPDTFTYTDQAEMMLRSWLSNEAAGVHTSIYYDWRDDGTNRTLGEDNFGVVGCTPARRPKQAYLARQKYFTHTGRSIDSLGE
jgi:hypothetical protein